MSRTTTRRARLLAVAALAALPLAVAAVPAQAAPTAIDLPPAAQGTVPGSWIVTLEPDAVSERVANEHAQAHGARIEHVYGHAINGYAARMSDQKAARVAQDPRVASVERDQVVSIAADALPTGIDRIGADVSPTAAIDDETTPAASPVEAVDVAVLDTGIAAHSDLNVVGGRNCSSGSSYNDGNGHGTHVAGTIAAKDNGSGVVGVAPGARLWAVRVLNNQGSGTRSSIICGINWVTANASTIDVVNMSLGGSGTDSACGGSDSYHNAICTSVDAGITYVVAAGNSTADAQNYVPATYKEVITVSALADFDGTSGGFGTATCRADVDDTLADFSNFGADIDLIAPGVCIRSTWLKGGYNTISGTSMASPHVAGAAALYLALHPGAPPAVVQAALEGAGNTVWINGTEKDGVQEKLLDVSTF